MEEINLKEGVYKEIQSQTNCKTPRAIRGFILTSGDWNNIFFFFFSISCDIYFTALKCVEYLIYYINFNILL